MQKGGVLFGLLIAVCVLVFAPAISPLALAGTPTSTPAQRMVGCWYSLLYHEGAPGSWANNRRDSLKIPVVGWGKDTLVGTYDMDDERILRRQLDAMKQAGIDFVLLDMTNGYGNKNEERIAHKIFRILKEIPKDKRLKVAIAIGKEFWGPKSYDFYSWKWVGWDRQESDQVSAMHRVLQDYARKYPSVYFQLEGNPLVVTFLNGLVEVREHPGMTLKRPLILRYPGATLRYALSWTATFRDSTRGDSGQEIDEMWGWGAKYPQPYHKKEMMIMPGTINWPLGGPPYFIDREGGRFYMRAWARILDKMPRIAVIADWNNWNEETAIEGCVGPHGWKDSLENLTYDWYMRITRAYATIFRGKLPTDTYLQEAGSDTVFTWNGKRLSKTSRQMPLAGEPVIELPTSFLSRLGYR